MQQERSPSKASVAKSADKYGLAYKQLSSQLQPLASTAIASRDLDQMDEGSPPRDNLSPRPRRRGQQDPYENGE